MAYTVEAKTEKATVSYFSGRQKLIRGFYVCSTPGRMTRRFMQGTAQKWTPELEANLRKQADDWAQVLNSHLPR